MNRDGTASRKLSDSDFWRICHEMHPIFGSDPTLSHTNYTFPVAPTLAGSVSDNNFGSSSSMLNDDDESNSWRFGRYDESRVQRMQDSEGSVSSDDSLQNLYAKKVQTNEQFLTQRANLMNTQKIYDTIELICDDQKTENGENKNDRVVDKKCERIALQRSANSFDSNESDTVNNADDLLLKIAASVQQLKENVNQTSELNDDRVSATLSSSPIEMEKNKTGSLNNNERFIDGDLIDFSDDWTVDGESKHSSSCADDKHIKKVTHSCDKGTRIVCFFSCMAIDFLNHFIL